MNKKFKFCETLCYSVVKPIHFCSKRGKEPLLVPSPFESYYLIKDLFSCTPSLVSQTLIVVVTPFCVVFSCLEQFFCFCRILFHN